MKKVLMLTFIVTSVSLYAMEQGTATVKNIIQQDLGPKVTDFMQKNPAHENATKLHRFVDFMAKEADTIINDTKKIEAGIDKVEAAVKPEVKLLEEAIKAIKNRSHQPAGTAAFIATGAKTDNTESDETDKVFNLIDSIKKEIEEGIDEIENKLKTVALDADKKFDDDKK